MRAVAAMVLLTFLPLLSGCHATIEASLEVEVDGGGRLAVGIHVDDDADRALQMLTGKRFADAFLVTDLIAAGWELERSLVMDGGSGVTASTRFESPDDAIQRLQSIAGQPPLVFEAFELRRDETLLKVDFEVGMILNMEVHVISEAIAAVIGKDDLTTLMREYDLSVTDDISAEVIVELPGSIRSANSDMSEYGHLKWKLDGGERREIRASSVYYQWSHIVIALVTSLAGITLAGVLLRDFRNWTRRSRARNLSNSR